MPPAVTKCDRRGGRSVEGGPRPLRAGLCRGDTLADSEASTLAPRLAARQRRTNRGPDTPSHRGIGGRAFPPVAIGSQCPSADSCVPTGKLATSSRLPPRHRAGTLAAAAPGTSRGGSDVDPAGHRCGDERGTAVFEQFDCAVRRGMHGLKLHRSCPDVIHNCTLLVDGRNRKPENSDRVSSGVLHRVAGPGRILFESRSCLYCRYCRRASSTHWPVSGSFSSTVATGMPFRLSVTSTDFRAERGAWREVKLAGQPQSVGGVARFKLRIQFVRGLEVRRAERSTVALEPMSQRGKRAVDVHPLAQIPGDLLSGPVAVQGLQPGALLRQGLADEGQDRLGEDCTAAVEAFVGTGNVSVLEQVRFDDGSKGGFRMTNYAHAAILASLCSSHHTATWQ